jgi:hypothetical protein
MKTGTFISIGDLQPAAASAKKTFIQTIEELSEFHCIHKEDNFPLKRSVQIIDFIGDYDPEIVMLHLGNQEYHASTRKLFRRKNTASPTGEKLSVETEPRTISLEKQATLNPLQKFLLLPMTWAIVSRKTRHDLQLIRELIKFYPEKKFVIVTPLPCLEARDTFIKNKAGKLMNRLFSGMANVTFINMHGRLPVDERIFADQFHLNAIGEKLMGRWLVKQMRQSFHSKFYLAAS